MLLPFVFLLNAASMEGATTSRSDDPAPKPLPINRRWDTLAPPHSETGKRQALLNASRLLNAEHTLRLAGARLTPGLLAKLSETPAGEPLVRAVRETLRRPIDLTDFLYFLDDVATASADTRKLGIWVSGGRARSEGILLHPDDVYKKRPRRYASRHQILAVDKPARPAELEPASDGDLLGPNWSARFVNPSDEAALFDVLKRIAPKFSDRVKSLITQLRAQGAEVYLTSTVRKKERGYLMWGAFYLSRAEKDTVLNARQKELQRLNKEWLLNIPIEWRHPGGNAKTREAARRMAEAYDVVYATRRGACCSDHYDGSAVDFVALGLPRVVKLVAPDGGKKTFDLSHPSEPRDLSLTPSLVHWIEQHFNLEKLRSDYPHWNDANR